MTRSCSPFIIAACLLGLSIFVSANHGDHHNHNMKLQLSERQTSTPSNWWYPNMKHQGRPAYGTNSTYRVWRNVRDYGAVGDGITDDTNAFNNATFDGNRCTYPAGCESSSTTPAIVYVPPGVYLISRPIVMPYYTQLVGDAVDIPILLGSPKFFGIAVVDSDPYLPYGYSWYQNQNNFWRHVRNFIIDMTLMPTTGRMSGIHWQVAQGTSLQNIVFNMAPYTTKNEQQGIFMDNGSGGWAEDLVFNGGGTGIFTGNQQWTWRNMTFNDCGTAIFQNWNWVFNYKSLSINRCQIGLDMTQGGNVITTSSIVMQDSVFDTIGIAGILTTFVANSTPVAAGTLVLDNVDFINTPAAISYPNETVILEGNQHVRSWIQGRAYTAFDGQAQVGNLTCYEPEVNSARVQRTADPPPKAVSLLDPSGKFYERSKTQYQGFPTSSFISIMDYGCSNDGVTDVTTCVQNFLNSIRTDQVAFIDNGAYVITNTIVIPNNIRMVGEIWPYFMVSGEAGNFLDQDNPQVAFQVGQPGDVGAVEIQEIIFETRGSVPGAIMMQWNLANVNGRQGANCLWDVHWRIGGTNGTELQTPTCTKTPNVRTDPNPACIASFLLLHITQTAELLMANNWGWISDHELDLPDHDQMNIYNGRGILVESQGPVWLYGTAFEHSMLYNYQIANAEAVYMGIIQTESAYMQSNPDALVPFTPQTGAPWFDPDFGSCFKTTCFKTWGLRIFNSNYIYLYGAGMYSFFDNYDSGCLLGTLCQQNMVSVEQSQGIYLYGVNTCGTENMVQVDGFPMVPNGPNQNGFTDTVAVFEYP